MDRDEIARRARPVLARHTGVRAAILYGSRSRGTARADSDVDIAVVGHDIDVLTLRAELSAALGLETDVVDLSTDPPIALLLNVLRHAMRLYERQPGAYAMFVSHSLCDLETDLPGHRRMHEAFVARVAQQGVLGER